MKTIITTLSLLFFCYTTSFAQQVDIFSLSYIYNSKVGLMNPPGPVLDAAELDVSELELKLLLPVKLKNGSTTIINGLEWQYLNTFFDQLPEDYVFEADLHEIQYTLGVNQKLNDKWGISVIAKPTFASNFNGGLTSDDFYMQGIAVVHYTIREGLRIGLGAAYTNGFGEPKLLPAINLRYQTEKFDLNLTAPFRIRATYKTGNFIAGLNSGVDGNHYNIRLGDKDQSIINKADEVKFSRFNIGPVLGWMIKGQGRIELSAGISLNRTFKLVDVDNEELDFDLNNGFFVKTGFYFSK